MDTLLASYIHDPLYRLATWVIIVQIFMIALAIAMSALIRWVKPQIAERRARGEHHARSVILKLLSAPQEDLGEQEVLTLFEEVSVRSLISAYEQLVSRLGQVEKRALRGSVIALKIEIYALGLTHSWFSWRRLEGALLLRSVGAVSAEERLIHLLGDVSPNVAFYAAWALVRVSPKRGQHYIIDYLDEEQGLSFSQRVHLMRELHLELLPLHELKTLFAKLSNRLKSVMVEAIILSRHAVALPVVREAINAQDVEVRISAFKAAATSRLGLTELELKQGLEDEAWPVRAQAVKAVGASKAINLIPMLCGCLADQEWWVRQNSARVLTQFGASGIEALRYVAHFSEDRFARDTARLMLSESVMYNSPEMMLSLNTQPMTPRPSEEISTQASRIINPHIPRALLTAEITKLGQDDPLSRNPPLQGD